MSRCRLGRAGVSGLNVEFQEAEPSSCIWVVSSVEERFERLAGVTLSPIRGECMLGVENLGGQRDLVAWLDGGRMFEEAAVEEKG